MAMAAGALEMKHSNLAVRAFTFAIIYLVAAVTLGILMVTGRAFDIFPGAVKIAHAHIALLGFVSVTIMGGMYQIVPTILGKKLPHIRLANIQLLLFNIGVIGISLGFLYNVRDLTVISGIIIATASYIFAYILIKTMKGNRLELTLKFFFAAIIYLVFAVTLGIFMATGKAYSIFPGNVSAAHAHLAVLGFVSMTIVGAMYQMFPMLSLRELYSIRIGSVSFWILNAGIAGYFISTLYRLDIILILSGIVFAAGAYLFGYNMFKTLKKEVKFGKKELDLSVKYFVAAIIYFLVTTLFGIYFLLGGGGGEGAGGGAGSAGELPVAGLIVVHTHLALVGWVAVTIIGAMYHLVPMLVWMERWGDKLGQEGVPLLTDLFSKKTGDRIFVLLNLGLVGFSLGYLMSNRIIEIISGTLMAVTFYLFAYVMLSIILGKVRS